MDWVRRSGTDQIEVYKDQAGNWRWRLISSNGEIVASSGESFTRKWSAKRAVKRVLRLRKL